MPGLAGTRFIGENGGVADLERAADGH